jgi:hypothetical protein
MWFLKRYLNSLLINFPLLARREGARGWVKKIADCRLQIADRRSSLTQQPVLSLSKGQHPTLSSYLVTS